MGERIVLSDFMNLKVRKFMPDILPRISIDNKFIIGIFTFFVTCVFFFPALEHAGRDAGFLYGGDVVGWYLPALMKTHSLLNGFHFSAMDFSTFGGSSDFFLSPNFFPFHPIVVFFSIVVSPEGLDFRHYGALIVILYFFHAFFALFYSYRLSREILNFGRLQSLLAALTYAFSLHMVAALGQPPFFLCATILPWIVWASWNFGETPSLRKLPWASFPVVLIVLSGYIPLALACLLLASILIFSFKMIEVANVVQTVETTIIFLMRAALPFVCGILLVAPYIFSLYFFHKETSSAVVPSLFYSAYQLAQEPQSILKLFSSQFAVPGKVIEFSQSFGFIPVAVGLIFIFSNNSHLTRNSITINRLAVLGCIYFATLIATFGEYSVLSDLVYHFVPQVGKMHIYQRFLLPAQLVFALLFAIVTSSVANQHSKSAFNVVFLIVFVLTFGSAFLVSFYPTVGTTLNITNALVFELFLCLLFLTVLSFGTAKWVVASACILTLLIPLNKMYDYTLHGHTLSNQSKRMPVALDKKYQEQVADYFSSHKGKDVVKYIDTTPMWGPGGTESFPKVFPYFVLENANIQSYGGFTFYLSALGSYMAQMPVRGNVEVQPNWNIINKTGGDFIVLSEEDFKSGRFEALIANDSTIKPFNLNNGSVIALLKSGFQKPAEVPFDNGYFKVKFNDDRTLANVALNKPAFQSSTIGPDANILNDGNKNGQFHAGTVSHSKLEKNAWVTIDLQDRYEIHKIVLWNRTDCCQERANDLRAFLTNTKPTFDQHGYFNNSEAIWSQYIPNIRETYEIDIPSKVGRFITIQYDPEFVNADEAYMSFAEIEVFALETTNAPVQSKATRQITNVNFQAKLGKSFKLEFNSTEPVSVDYLFWNNPRLKYYINGEEFIQVNSGDYLSFPLPAGRNTVEVVYSHKLLSLFKYTYFGYFILIFFSFFGNKALIKPSLIVNNLRKPRR